MSITVSFICPALFYGLNVQQQTRVSLHIVEKKRGTNQQSKGLIALLIFQLIASMAVIVAEENDRPIIKPCFFTPPLSLFRALREWITVRHSHFLPLTLFPNVVTVQSMSTKEKWRTVGNTTILFQLTLWAVFLKQSMEECLFTPLKKSSSVSTVLKKIIFHYSKSFDQRVEQTANGFQKVKQKEKKGSKSKNQTSRSSIPIVSKHLAVHMACVRAYRSNVLYHPGSSFIRTLGKCGSKKSILFRPHPPQDDNLTWH